MSDFPTQIFLRWGGPANVTLAVNCPSRPLTSDELHDVANVVCSIEEFRAVVAGEVPELES